MFALHLYTAETVLHNDRYLALCVFPCFTAAVENIFFDE